MSNNSMPPPETPKAVLMLRFSGRKHLFYIPDTFKINGELFTVLKTIGHGGFSSVRLRILVNKFPFALPDPPHTSRASTEAISALSGAVSGVMRCSMIY